MKLRNKFPTKCCSCGRPIHKGEGILLGKDPYLRRWRTRCNACEERLTCGVSRPSVPNFFAQELDDTEQDTSLDEVALIRTVGP